jgi:hypothetical protein
MTFRSPIAIEADAHTKESVGEIMRAADFLVGGADELQFVLPRRELLEGRPNGYCHAPTR